MIMPFFPGSLAVSSGFPLVVSQSMMEVSPSAPPVFGFWYLDD